MRHRARRAPTTHRSSYVSQVAFTLRADFDDGSFAGTVSLPDSDVIVLHEALDEGKGTIVTSDPHVIAALDNVVALKRTTLPKDAPQVEDERKVSPALAGTSGLANEGLSADEIAAARAEASGEPTSSDVTSDAPQPTGSATTAAGSTAKGSDVAAGKGKGDS